MALTKDEILLAAMALEPHERDGIAEALWLSLLECELPQQQMSEVRERVSDIDIGRVDPISGEEVMEEFRKRYGR